MDSAFEPRGRMSAAGQSASEELVDLVLSGIALTLLLVVPVYILDPVVRALVLFEVVIIVGLGILGRHRYGNRLIDVDMPVEGGVGTTIISGIGTQDVEKGMDEQQRKELGFGPDEVERFSGVSDDEAHADDSEEEREGRGGR